MKKNNIENKLLKAYGLDEYAGSTSAMKADTNGIFETLLKNDREADACEKLSQKADLEIVAALRERKNSSKAFQEQPGFPRFVFAMAGALALLAIIVIPLAFIPQTKLVSSGFITVDGAAFSGNKTGFSKTVIVVPPGSKASIQRKGSFSIIAESSSSISYNFLSPKKIELSLMDGDVCFSIRKNFGDVRVTTINAVLKVTGTCFDVNVDRKKEMTTVILKEGSVQVWNIASSNLVTTVHPGESVFIRGVHSPQAQLISDSEPRTVKVIPRSSHKSEIVNSKSNRKERVYLRNGNIIIGKIISQKDGRITLRTSYADLTYENNDVEKIEYIP